MAIIGTKGGYRGKAGLGGLARVRDHRGSLSAVSWHRHSTRRKPKILSDSVREFDAVAAMYAKIDPEIKRQVREAAQGTQWLARDIHTVMMYGTFFAIEFGPNEVIYPMTAQSNVSQSLDIISQQPGSMLFRGPEQWTVIPPGVPSYVPIWQGDGTVLWREPWRVLNNIASTPGMILYRNNTQWVGLPKGTTGQRLTMLSSGFPGWA